MLATSHLLAGAAVGTAIGNPLLAFILGYISHFLLDALPHFDPGLYRKRKADGSLPEEFARFEYPIAAIDVLLGVFLTMYFWHLHAESSALLFGALGGLLPDLFDNVPFWNKQVWKINFLHSMAKLHQTIHFPVLPRNLILVGIPVQLLVFALTIAWLWR